MKLKIHRGTEEIGGSCVEVWTEHTKIIIDFGMPLVDKDKKEFNFTKYKNLSTDELVKKEILPEIEGLYDSSQNKIDAILISHAHPDHYGLTNFIDSKVKYYLGEATHEIIKINNIFTPQEIDLKNTTYFENGKKFKIGDITITPYLMDHSAFDSYSFLIEANGKSLFYSGDFRSHGRHTEIFKNFIEIAPKNVDYLLLEGTTISSKERSFKTEEELEKDIIKVIEKKDKINLVYVSGQNIDRLISIYEACIKTDKILVVDVYIASVLKTLAKYKKIPYPSKEYKNIKVMFAKYTSDRLKKIGKKKILYQFRYYKIKKEEINQQYKNIVMAVRPSMKKDLKLIENIKNGNLIYSLWEGYLKKPITKRFMDFLKEKNIKIHKIHTSGHADTTTLKKMVEAIQPKNIIPIHTFEKSKYKNIFKENILELKDKETKEL